MFLHQFLAIYRPSRQTLSPMGPLRATFDAALDDVKQASKLLQGEFSILEISDIKNIEIDTVVKVK